VNRQIELGEDVFEDLLERDVGVEDENRLGLRVEIFQETLEKRGLAVPASPIRVMKPLR
jgi:hypothetical protein